VHVVLHDKGFEHQGDSKHGKMTPSEQREALLTTSGRKTLLLQIPLRAIQFIGYELFVRRNGLVLGFDHLIGKVVEGVA
jgi:hypothetical protein